MQIIETYVQNLMLNLPNKKEKEEKEEKEEDINIILDGGIFNGSYLIGAFYFLREMEKQNYIKIHKISCCSISSVCTLLYFADALDLITELYDIFTKQFKTNHNLNMFEDCFKKIRLRIKNPKQLCKRFNSSVYISYYDIKKGTKVIVNKFKTVDDIFNAVHRSCFVPFFINGDAVYKNRFFDGVNPYILPDEPGRKLLYIDLLGSDKIGYLLSIKNEKTNFHRILAGLLDIHLFYIKKCDTQMCSYVNKWSPSYILRNRITKFLVEKIIFYIVYFICYIKQHIPPEIYERIIFKIISKIIKELYVVFIDAACF
jgi:hypothetical protein